jgi:hypothetical protein
VSIPVLILLPPAGTTPAEAWVAEGRRAAASDLVGRLQQVPAAGPIWFQAAEHVDLELMLGMGCLAFEAGAGPQPFHFGKVLASFAERYAPDRLAYFGGASAPLASADALGHAFDLVLQADAPIAAVNNYYSTDWLVMRGAQRVLPLALKLASDNPLGWLLDHEAGCKVTTLPVQAGTQADIDTPGDLLMIHGHADLGPAMRAFLDHAPAEALERTRRLRCLLQTPASTLAIIGRSSSGIWREVERRTQIWIRLFVEERGMMASGRAERGEVRSLIGQMVDDLGPAEFVRRLSGMADGAVWDTRVWMAQRLLWPSPGDRFAADLGWVDQVQDPALRDLTLALAHAQIPIVTGGHSVVAGSLLALLETIRAE